MNENIQVKYTYVIFGSYREVPAGTPSGAWFMVQSTNDVKKAIKAYVDAKNDDSYMKVILSKQMTVGLVEFEA